MNLTAANKPRLRLSEIINMSVGFFGIQFGWDLQRANMGPIYENLGAKPDDIPLLFLAAPLTGLLVQPIIGYLSDRTWHPTFGRRRPYFFIGALFSSIAIFFMPHSSALWMAAGLLWIMDVFGNVAMEPFRAFVADKLPDSQLNQGFIMQSLMIGLGGTIASALPWMMRNWFGFENTAASGAIPENVKLSFYIGGGFFLLAVLYTVFSTKEYPPSAAETKERAATSGKGISGGIQEIMHAITHMPKTMKAIALVQFFTWPGLFLMWFYYSTAVAYNIFGATSNTDAAFGDGRDFAGLTLSFYNIITFAFAFILPFIAKACGRKLTHAICLTAGAIGLIAVAFVTNKYLLFACMTGVGIAWSSILSMPYAILAPSLPSDKIGVYMGIFNFFIVLPEIIASLFFGWIMEHVLDNNRMAAVQIGGILMLLAAVMAVLLIKEPKKVTEAKTDELKIEENRSI